FVCVSLLWQTHALHIPCPLHTNFVLLYLYLFRSISFRFFSPRCRPPPISTLFPYTTLFRSGNGRSIFQITFGCFNSPGNPSIGVDRKSTRLNSSHVSISYAVFCLKKKTQKKSTTPRRINI